MSEYQREYQRKNKEVLKMKRQAKRERSYINEEHRRQIIKKQCENLKKYGRLG